MENLNLLQKLKRKAYSINKNLVVQTIKRFVDQTKTQFTAKDVTEYVNKKWNLWLPYHQILQTMK